MAEEIAKEICLRPRRRLSFPNMQHLNRRSEPFVSTFTNNRINDKQAGSKRQGIDSVRRLTVSMFSLRGTSVKERSHSAPPTPTNLRTTRSNWRFQPAISNELFSSGSSINKSSSHDSTRLKEDTTSMTQVCCVTRGPADPTDGSAGAPLSMKNIDGADVVQTSRSSKARQKKFHRHFKQVDIDEKVLNYYSCALVGDILLQGHLYITENFFAFYSNVFGYVTKLLIPTVDVLKISKEKTAKIIPNAVGISTEDEKHVFGSLLSRDSTYKFMLEVWKAANSSQPIVNITPPEAIKPEPSEDDSTGSSGNEEQSSFITTLGTGASSENLQKFLKKRSLAALELHQINRQWLSFRATALMVVTVALLTFLFASAGYLLYRIALIQNQFKDLSFSGKRCNFESDIYEDILKWQATLHSSSADKIQEFLSVNLNHIMKIRLSLEALSVLMTPKKNDSEKSNLHHPPWENVKQKDSHDKSNIRHGSAAQELK
ncbi:hypothetical protein RUM43_000121 [Polyplax serrata]|uniref:GRAM domain-containing protein n=1 Tax=Polyplax serrata TaxID=468196 RepID=A0AAN8SBU8_POLSC